MKLKTKNRGFNFLGKQVDISDGTNDVSGPFGTDVELLKFYIKMLYEGTLKIGSSGFKRMCTIKDRVIEQEKEMLIRCPALLGNKKRRKFIADICNVVSKAQEIKHTH